MGNTQKAHLGPYCIIDRPGTDQHGLGFWLDECNSPELIILAGLNGERLQRYRTLIESKNPIVYRMITQYDAEQQRSDRQKRKTTA